MQYKSFKQCFSEKLSARAAILKSQTPNVKRKIESAGGEAVIAGAVANEAGINPSVLSKTERTVDSGKNVPNTTAQKIAKAVMSIK